MLKVSRFLIIFIVLLSVSSELLSAQPRKQLFGEVPNESTDTKKTDSYLSQQNEALEYSKTISSILTKRSQGVANPSLSEGAAFYLSGLYLYCSAKAGACPFILDTILAGEYLRNQGLKTKSCTDMKSFWQSWVKNGFEQRLAYLVPIGSSGAMKTFNEQHRSIYIKCEDTLATFQSDSQIERSVALTSKLIEQVQLKKLNVFEETGAFTTKKEE